MAVFWRKALVMSTSSSQVVLNFFNAKHDTGMEYTSMPTADRFVGGCALMLLQLMGKQGKYTALLW